ncbi:hypothetical protein J2T02_004204 [Chitinophaga terrae (ex Kim and Jung 2007)]|uniref:type IX secretion system outer membrane channel protein PorV n=1 Tax=Chitinophaga terrae (ex Kim and Jung 2007) TaxID=408074 RepID=UPI00278602DA|nr:type IX secretion system outer membrane channel protein PorV [Chitinophaga terrae (ex Kim and Jung 2007)]MDQ0109063.1 hypothetical protein [Chitinophaga terrae (ex Kim and Jung 2007)]
MIAKIFEMMYAGFYQPLVRGMLCIALILAARTATAQISLGNTDGRTNAISTAVPFLRITPDARSAALGDAGMALSPDANAVFHNLSTLPFSRDERSVAGSFSPWLRSMASDVYLANLSGYRKLDENQAIGAGFRFFNLGSIELTDFQGQTQGNVRPSEFSLEGGYARRLNEHWGVGLAFRYIHSKLASGAKAGGSGSYRAGNAFAGDLSFSYISTTEEEEGTGTWRFGGVLSNIGTKISYSKDAQDKYFLPANLGIGGSYTYRFDGKNSLALTLDINKLMAPSPDTVDTNKDGTPDYRQKGLLSGVFGSFGDAPGGLKEEFQELMYSSGLEYQYDHLLAIRAGYYNEHRNKGNRKYLTAGFGLKYKLAGLDFSYLVPAGGAPLNPLANTLRITLSVTW